MTIGLFIVDDHPIVLAGLAAAFSRRTDVVIIAHATNLLEARAGLRDSRIDVVLLDLRLPDGSGLELFAEAEHLPRRPAIVIFSTFCSPEYVDAAVSLGARGFVLKTAPLEAILEAVTVAASGGQAFPSKASTHGRRIVGRRLSEREHDIIAGVMAGGSNDEIGRDLALARKTVEAYLARLFMRFNVNSRTELGVLAEHEHLMDLPLRPAARTHDGLGGQVTLDLDARVLGRDERWRVARECRSRMARKY